MAKRALITGLSGFTGQYMAAELRGAGYEVYGLGDHPGSDAPPAAVDITDLASVAAAVEKIQPDYVVHLAAQAFVAHGDANAFYRVNLIGTRNLLEALVRLDHAPQCILLASSANVYGNAAGGVLSETQPPNPANDYAVSKLGMECMARLWCDRLPIVITRPFNYTGVGQSENFLIPKIVAHFRRRAATLELGNLDVWRDFSDVRQVVRAYRRLLEVRPTGEVFNICSGVAHSLREVIELCSELSGHTVQVVTNPAFVRANEVHVLKGDPAKLQGLLGAWHMPPLRQTLEWMLEPHR